jgi:hypothetical protein
MKFCPFINRDCYGSGCQMWSDNTQCCCIPMIHLMLIRIHDQIEIELEVK